MSHHQAAANRFFAKLKRELPTIHPIRLSFCKLKDDDCFGYCDLVKDKETGKPVFEISLSAKDAEGFPWYLVRELIIHEYAHALCWTKTHRNLDDHGPWWGVMYAEVYRIAMR